MRLAGTRALARLRNLRKSVVTTADAVLSLGLTRSAASRTLARLAEAGLLLKVRRGLWSLDATVDPLTLAEHLTAPFPAYISFLSALQLHGMISQIPQVIYVASLAPTRRLKTRLASYSIHRLAPSFFGGFETAAGGVRLARPEKALLDTLYLAPSRSRLFAHLPELELPQNFDTEEARRWIARMAPGPRRAMVEQRLNQLVGADVTARRSARRTARR